MGRLHEISRANRKSAQSGEELPVSYNRPESVSYETSVDREMAEVIGQVLKEEKLKAEDDSKGSG